MANDPTFHLERKIQALGKEGADVAKLLKEIEGHIEDGANVNEIFKWEDNPSGDPNKTLIGHLIDAYISGDYVKNRDNFLDALEVVRDKISPADIEDSKDAYKAIFANPPTLPTSLDSKQRNGFIAVFSDLSAVVEENRLTYGEFAKRQDNLLYSRYSDEVKGFSSGDASKIIGKMTDANKGERIKWDDDFSKKGFGAVSKIILPLETVPILEYKAVIKKESLDNLIEQADDEFIGGVTDKQWKSPVEHVYALGQKINKEVSIAAVNVDELTSINAYYKIFENVPANPADDYFNFTFGGVSQHAGLSTLAGKSGADLAASVFGENAELAAKAGYYAAYAEKHNNSLPKSFYAEKDQDAILGKIGRFMAERELMLLNDPEITRKHFNVSEYDDFKPSTYTPSPKPVYEYLEKINKSLEKEEVGNTFSGIVASGRETVASLFGFSNNDKTGTNKTYSGPGSLEDELRQSRYGVSSASGRINSELNGNIASSATPVSSNTGGFVEVDKDGKPIANTSNTGGFVEVDKDGKPIANTSNTGGFVEVDKDGKPIANTSNKKTSTGTGIFTPDPSLKDFKPIPVPPVKGPRNYKTEDRGRNEDVYKAPATDFGSKVAKLTYGYIGEPELKAIGISSTAFAAMDAKEAALQFEKLAIVKIEQDNFKKELETYGEGVTLAGLEDGKGPVSHEKAIAMTVVFGSRGAAKIIGKMNIGVELSSEYEKKQMAKLDKLFGDDTQQITKNTKDNLKNDDINKESGTNVDPKKLYEAKIAQLEQNIKDTKEQTDIARPREIIISEAKIREFILEKEALEFAAEKLGEDKYGQTEFNKKVNEFKDANKAFLDTPDKTIHDFITQGYQNDDGTGYLSYRKERLSEIVEDDKKLDDKNPKNIVNMGDLDKEVWAAMADTSGINLYEKQAKHNSENPDAAAIAAGLKGIITSDKEVITSDDKILEKGAKDAASGISDLVISSDNTKQTLEEEKGLVTIETADYYLMIIPENIEMYLEQDDKAPGIKYNEGDVALSSAFLHKGEKDGGIPGSLVGLSVENGKELTPIRNPNHNDFQDGKYIHTNFADNNGITVRDKDGNQEQMTYAEWTDYEKNPYVTVNKDGSLSYQEGLTAYQSGLILRDKDNTYDDKGVLVDGDGGARGHNPHDPTSTSKNYRTVYITSEEGDRMIMSSRNEITPYQAGKFVEELSANDLNKELIKLGRDDVKIKSSEYDAIFVDGGKSAKTGVQIAGIQDELEPLTKGVMVGRIDEGNTKSGHFTNNSTFIHFRPKDAPDNGVGRD